MNAHIFTGRVIFQNWDLLFGKVLGLDAFSGIQDLCAIGSNDFTGSECAGVSSSVRAIATKGWMIVRVLHWCFGIRKVAGSSLGVFYPSLSNVQRLDSRDVLLSVADARILLEVVNSRNHLIDS